MSYVAPCGDKRIYRQIQTNKRKGTSPVLSGIKWTYDLDMAQYCKKPQKSLIEELFLSGVPNYNNLRIEQYYVSDISIMKTIRDMVNNEIKKSTKNDELALLNSVTNKLLSEAIGVTLKGIKGGQPIAFALGLAEELAKKADEDDLAMLLSFSFYLTDAIENSKVVVFSHVNCTTCIPKHKLRLAETDKKSVSTVYDYQFEFDSGLEYYMPKDIVAYGDVEYLSYANMLREIKNEIAWFGWKTIKK